MLPALHLDGSKFLGDSKCETGIHSSKGKGKTQGTQGTYRPMDFKFTCRRASGFSLRIKDPDGIAIMTKNCMEV